MSKVTNEERRLREYLTTKEMEALLKAAKEHGRKAHRNYCLILLGYYHVYCKQKLVLGDELQEYKAEICERMKRLFGYSSLVGWYIARYRFNYIAANPYGYLDKLDCDHIVQDNPNMRKLAAFHGTVLPDSWLKATNDIFSNTGPKPRPEHQGRHAKDGGGYAFPFNRTDYHSS